LIAANVLPEAIKEFRSHRPGLHIRVFDVGGDALTRLVEDGQVDMSLGGFFKPHARDPPHSLVSLFLDGHSA
jgi:DNA-binding transcriptional LysR family regulator